MKELLDNIKKIFSKKLTLAVVLVIVAALAIVGLCTWYHFSIEPLGNGYAAYAFWRLKNRKDTKEVENPRTGIPT